MFRIQVRQHSTTMGLLYENLLNVVRKGKLTCISHHDNSADKVDRYPLFSWQLSFASFSCNLPRNLHRVYTRLAYY